MRKLITIKAGEVTIEVLDGHGPACREDTASYRRRLQDEFGIDSKNIREEELPAMHQLPGEQTKEGQTLV